MDAAEGEAPRAGPSRPPRAPAAELAECRRQHDVAEADVREATRRLRANAEDLFDARREIARLQATLRRRERAAEAENDAVGTRQKSPPGNRVTRGGRVTRDARAREASGRCRD